MTTASLRLTDFQHYSIMQHGVVKGLPVGESYVYLKKGIHWSILFYLPSLSFHRVKTNQLSRLGLIKAQINQKAEMDLLYEMCGYHRLEPSQFLDITRCIRRGTPKYT